MPRSLEVIFNTIGDKQYAAANIKPKFYSEAKRLSPEELAEANKFKAMIFSAASVCDDLIGCKIIATTVFKD